MSTNPKAKKWTIEVFVDHELKCHHEFFDDLLNGKKPFEVRKDDREFKVGDILMITEVFPINEDNMHFVQQENFPRRACFKVTYKLAGEKWGIKEGFCVLGVKKHSL